MARVIGSIENQVAEFKAVDLLSPEFVARVTREFGGLKVEHICVYVPDGEKYKVITLGHTSPKLEGEGIAYIRADDPERLEKAMRAVFGGTPD